MTTLKLNKEELLRRQQDLRRRGVRTSFTYQIQGMRSRNTPQGASKPSASFLKVYDPKQQAAERAKRLKDVGKPSVEAKFLIPKDVLLAHAVHITRHDLGLRQDRLTRTIPTLECPGAKREIQYRCPEGLSIYEKKLWAKMPPELKGFRT